MPTQHGGILKPLEQAINFTIYRIDEDGNPASQYSSTNPMTTVVVTSINICQAMLKTPKVRYCFIEQAGKHRPNAWFRRDRPNQQEALEHVVDKFIKEMHTNFPGIFLDYTWQNPRYFGCHYRHPYEGEFKGSDQYIVLNGKRTRNMLDRAIEAQNAAIEAPNTKPDSDEMREYEAFLFMFANTLLHEIAHVLTTYLTRGKLDTPANMPSEVSISPEAAGEAGFDIEYSVFGGVMYYQHDPDHVTPNDTCGTAYVQRKNKRVYRVKLGTIKNTVNHTFKFPYECDPEEPRRLKSFGEGIPRDAKIDPLLHPDWPKLRDAPPPIHH